MSGGMDRDPMEDRPWKKPPVTPTNPCKKASSDTKKVSKLDGEFLLSFFGFVYSNMLCVSVDRLNEVYADGGIFSRLSLGTGISKERLTQMFAFDPEVEVSLSDIVKISEATGIPAEFTAHEY